MNLVKPRQYEDWTELRLEDRSSPAYRKGVNRLAQRLADTVLAVSSVPEPVSEPQRQEHETTEDEAPGILELLAEAEDAMPRWQRVVEEFGPVLEQLAEIAQAGTVEMEASDHRGGGAAGRVRVAARIAAGMREPANEILRLGEQNTREVEVVDAAITAMLDAMEEDPPATPSEREQALELFKSVEEMVRASAESTVGLEQLSGSLNQAARITRTMRPIARDLQRGLRGFVDAQAIYDDWSGRIHEIRPLLEPCSAEVFAGSVVERRHRLLPVCECVASYVSPAVGTTTPERWSPKLVAAALGSRVARPTKRACSAARSTTKRAARPSRRKR